MRLARVHTIPVYEGMSVLESWFRIVEADGEPVAPGYASRPLEGWANVGIFESSAGIVAAPLLDDHTICF